MPLNVFNFTSSGHYGYDNGILSYQSFFGTYWSRTRNVEINGYSYYLGFNTTLGTRDTNVSGYGFSLRCLAASEIL